MKTNTGIYIIICTKTNKYYIGYASEINSRFRHHKSTLKNNTHKNTYLQRAWNKYGEENFRFEVLERCHKNQLCFLEHWWVIVLGARNPKYGYNLAPTNSKQIAGNNRESALKGVKTRRQNGKHLLTAETKKKIGNANRGRKMSDLMKKKLSIANKGKKLSEKHINIISEIHSKKVYQYDLQGNFMKEWKKVREAAEFYNFCEDSISQAARKERMSANFLWSYNKYSVYPNLYFKGKNVIGINNKGEVIEFPSLKDAAIAVGLKYSSNINSSIKYGWKAGGYKWKYK